MTALPPLTDVLFDSETHPMIIKAYESSLHTEENSMQHDLVFARMLGYLILHSPSISARECVALDILSCTSQSEHLRLGETYVNQFIRPFLRFEEVAYEDFTPDSDDSGECDEGSKKMTKDKVVEHPQPENPKHAKETALIRDGFRCTVTKRYDKRSLTKGSKIRQEAFDDQDPLKACSLTTCCHIFSDTGTLPSRTTDVASTRWALLERFGYSKLVAELRGNNIHRLENLITISTDIQYSFERLWFWFESTSEPNCYKVILRGDMHPFILGYPPSTVTFTSTDANLPLPSPLYLSIHAACAKIAYLSGATEYIEMMHRETADLQVLSDDGSSADLLTHALLGV